ncbi:tyrosine-type recombinase/integrase [Levilactobacillus namurensis]|uniref:Tyrosine-type recombinase/integrase n=1 Tax=Levilactobacillus namurensis TaxID=380393 RepID=A0AAW8W5K6_9LACO|nr:tyrosine-type recombinase/integrase [Levilactobacillus namurensis]MDT7015301.1 tyrosine-type recombinase/integrase [Levilactobacillus namurensis]
MPSPQTKSKNYWTSKQLATFLSTVVHEDNLRNDYQRSALFYLLATTGMRKGEALALTWQDVDLVNGHRDDQQNNDTGPRQHPNGWNA